MEINLHNYEAVFLDYYEGNLSAEDVSELLLFLENHPELKGDFESFENIVLEDFNQVVFENKESLKKSVGDKPNIINISNYDEYFIRAVENDLTAEEQVSLDKYLQQHPQYAVDYRLYQLTKLKADTTEVFENKESLKHKDRKIIPLYYYVAVAAAVLLLFGLFQVFNNGDKTIQVANNNIVKPANVKAPVSGNLFGDVVPLVKTTTVAAKSSSRKTSSSSNAVVNNNPVKEMASSVMPIVTPVPAKVENAVENFTKVEEQPIAKKDEQNVVPLNNEPYVEKAANDDYPSFWAAAASRIKENVLDETTVAAQKKSGILQKMSGWDVAQIMAKGVSKLTGRHVQLKPTYNDKGDVTAYAFESDRFEMSHGR
jgi:hypothetical protein